MYFGRSVILSTAAMIFAHVLVPMTAVASPAVFPTGVTVYDATKAYNGYVVFGGADNKTHLIDMDGHEVHQWAFIGQPSTVLDPKMTGGKLGHVFVQLSTLEDDTDANTGTGLNPGEKLLHSNKSIGELDWGGRVVWQWGDRAPGGAARQHHDLRRLANGNTLVLANWIHPIPGFKIKNLYDDVIYEVTPTGDIVWKWVASDHLLEFGFDAAALALLHDTSKADYLHLNDMAPLGPNHWFDAGDTRFDPENIVIDSREANFIVIIDKKAGNVVWRIGPDLPLFAGVGAALPRPVDQTSGQHDSHIIPAGLPGAGNLLVFDNQGPAGYPSHPLPVLLGSRVLEIDPIKKEIVWQYVGTDSNRPSWSFYSSFISSARRLPNGNTLIDEGMNGRFFQVTPRGEIVWEYISPYFAPSPLGGKSVLSNFVYRAQPVPYSWVPAGTPHAENAVLPPTTGATPTSSTR
jgi:Arylsulfotransferase (ASST)